MNTDDIYSVLQDISSESSSKQKETILKYNETDDMKSYLEWVYNPFKRYYVSDKIARKELKNVPYGQSNDIGSLFSILDKLHRRFATGNDAIELLKEYAANGSESFRELLFYALKKDVRAGINIKTINKVYDNVIPNFQLMLAEPFAEKHHTIPAIVQPKFDGIRICFIYEDGELYIRTRAGKEMVSLDHLEDQVSTFIKEEVFPKIVGEHKNILIDTEAMGSIDSFNQTVSILRQQNEPALDADIRIFGIYGYSEPISEQMKVGYLNKSYRELDSFYLIQQVDTDYYPNLTIADSYWIENHDEAFDYYKNFRKKGLEGAVVKKPFNTYEFKRSKTWIKIKPSETHDLTITGIKEGTGRLKESTGSVIVDYNGVEVAVSGMTDKMREEVWKSPDDFINMTAEIEAHETTEDGSLRHPRVVRFRMDK